MLNISKMKEKAEKLENPNAGKKDGVPFFRMKKGEKYTIRVLPDANGDPFREFHFHYGVEAYGLLCPNKTFGEPCPICEFATSLWQEGTAESKAAAKELFARQRYNSFVVERGKEDEGAKVWAYGKGVYKSFLTAVLDPDYGDITDVDAGNDVKLSYYQTQGQNFPSTDVTFRPFKTPLCSEEMGRDECAEMLESIPSWDSVHESRTYEDLQQSLEKFCNKGKESQTDKYGAATEDSASKVDQAVKDLQNA